MKSFEFWQRWLLVVTLIIIGFGILIALLSGTAIFDLFDDQINPVFWDSKTVNENTEDFQQWVYGVLGAMMAGWGVSLAFITHYAFKRRERWAWISIVVGLLVWYGVDTSISVLSGVYFNAFVNSVLLLLILPPLFFTRTSFTHA